MRRWRWLVAVVCGLTIMESTPAHAEAVGPLRKLIRGTTNVATGWLELPFQVARTTELEGSLSGLSMGVARGIGLGMARTLVGGYELVTFAARNYAGSGGRDPYGALIEPAFVVFRQPDKP